MSFAFPLALFGLLAVPALVAIYWLRSRSKRRVVSSLMLWMDQRQLKEGGLLIHRLQTPLLFLLELLSILLLVFAAAGPIVRAGEAATPLVVVLDDSFSMRAGGEDSSRRRGEDALRKELRGHTHDNVRIVLAGSSPQILGETTGDERQLNDLLDHWKCFSPAANLDEAITFAFALGGERARTLVITDHPPSAEGERIEWLALGKNTANVAFVNAARTARDGEDRCILEVANLSHRAVKTALVVEIASADDSTRFHELRRSEIALAEGGAERVVLTLGAGAGPLRARIASDELEVDNQVVLLPDRERTVPVEIRIRDETLREILSNAIRSVTTAAAASGDAEIVITDEATSVESSRGWIVRVLDGENAESYIGPFVLDRNHPLAEGLPLEGVIWGAGRAADSAGSPVIMAGNTPLVSDIDRADGRREIRVSFRPEMSTLQRTPALPILMWNLVSWRASELPGVTQSNVRLGGDAKIKLPTGIQEVEITQPDGEHRRLTTVERSASLTTESPGLYAVAAGNETYSFSANALRKEESDLRGNATGHWGSQFDRTAVESERRNISWLFLLLLMIALALHLAVASRGLVSSNA